MTSQSLSKHLPLSALEFLILLSLIYLTYGMSNRITSQSTAIFIRNHGNQSFLVNGDDIQMGKLLMMSPFCSYAVNFHTYGNLCIYKLEFEDMKNASLSATWCTMTQNLDSGDIFMQDDGNFRAYTRHGKAYWGTGAISMGNGNDIYPKAGYYVTLQNDGNLAIYPNNGTTPIWSCSSHDSYDYLNGYTLTSRCPLDGSIASSQCGSILNIFSTPAKDVPLPYKLTSLLSSSPSSSSFSSSSSTLRKTLSTVVYKRRLQQTTSPPTPSQPTCGALDNTNSSTSSSSMPLLIWPLSLDGPFQGVGSLLFSTGRGLELNKQQFNYNWWNRGLTFEAWVKYLSFANASVPLTGQLASFGLMQTQGNVNYWSFGPNDMGQLSFNYWSGVPNSITAPSRVLNVNLNTWTHICLQISSSNIIYMFVSGRLVFSYQLSVPFRLGTERIFSIGQYNSNIGPVFLSSEVRLVYGSNIYPLTGFSPPTTPLKDPTKQLLASSALNSIVLQLQIPSNRIPTFNIINSNFYTPLTDFARAILEREKYHYTVPLFWLGRNIIIVSDRDTAWGGGSIPAGMLYYVAGQGATRFFPLSQIITVAPGMDYTYDFWARSRPGHPTNILCMEFDSILLGTYVLTNSWVRFTGTWRPQVTALTTGTFSIFMDDKSCSGDCTWQLAALNVQSVCYRAPSSPSSFPTHQPSFASVPNAKTFQGIPWISKVVVSGSTVVVGSGFTNCLAFIYYGCSSPASPTCNDANRVTLRGPPGSQYASSLSMSRSTLVIGDRDYRRVFLYYGCTSKASTTCNDNNAVILNGRVGFGNNVFIFGTTLFVARDNYLINTVSIYYGCTSRSPMCKSAGIDRLTDQLGFDMLLAARGSTLVVGTVFRRSVYIYYDCISNSSAACTDANRVKLASSIVTNFGSGVSIDGSTVAVASTSGIIFLYYGCTSNTSTTCTSNNAYILRAYNEPMQGLDMSFSRGTLVIGSYLSNATYIYYGCTSASSLTCNNALRVAIAQPNNMMGYSNFIDGGTLAIASNTFNALNNVVYLYFRVPMFLLAPTFAPTRSPTRFPTQRPTLAPTLCPSTVPTIHPSAHPTLCPSGTPSMSPSVSPSVSPSLSPTWHPTQSPTSCPTCIPSCKPTVLPSPSPSKTPTMIPTAAPTHCPSKIPTLSPSHIPTMQPSLPPTPVPSPAPTISPSMSPTQSPSIHPTVRPTSSPSALPSLSPTHNPSLVPSISPSLSPSMTPSHFPTTSPSTVPSIEPTRLPTICPSQHPTNSPSHLPTVYPSTNPTMAPSCNPTAQPTLHPSHIPTARPSTSPTLNPTYAPSNAPTNVPTVVPTVAPTVTPTESPTHMPTAMPTHLPSQVPTISPTILPTKSPSDLPTLTPTLTPTLLPTTIPSHLPTTSPTEIPSHLPSCIPTQVPTLKPTHSPSSTPTTSPSCSPSSLPSYDPTIHPTNTPSINPTHIPSLVPTHNPSETPSNIPTTLPSIHPSNRPTDHPSIEPTAYPTHIPSTRPSMHPSAVPSEKPTKIPTVEPSPHPSVLPSCKPSVKPTYVPTKLPSHFPSVMPTAHPSYKPTPLPSTHPTTLPSVPPSPLPTSLPSTPPSIPPDIPTLSPTLQILTQPTLVPTSPPSSIIDASLTNSKDSWNYGVQVFQVFSDCDYDTAVLNQIILQNAIMQTVYTIIVNIRDFQYQGIYPGSNFIMNGKNTTSKTLVEKQGLTSAEIHEIHEIQKMMTTMEDRLQTEGRNVMDIDKSLQDTNVRSSNIVPSIVVKYTFAIPSLAWYSGITESLRNSALNTRLFDTTLVQLINQFNYTTTSSSSSSSSSSMNGLKSKQFTTKEIYFSTPFRLTVMQPTAKPTGK